MRWIAALVLASIVASPTPASAQLLVGMRPTRQLGASYDPHATPLVSANPIETEILGGIGIGVAALGAVGAVIEGVTGSGDWSDQNFVIPLAVLSGVCAIGVVMAVFSYLDLFTRQSMSPSTFSLRPGGLTLAF